MQSRKKTVLSISLLTLSSLIAAFWLHSISMVVNIVADASSHLRLISFKSEEVWGAKLETTDKSRQLFAGIQSKTATIDIGNDALVLANAGSDDGKRPNDLPYYKFEIGKIGILIKVISYEYRSPEERDDPPGAGQLKHLNYIVESSTFNRRSKNYAVLLGQDNTSGLGMPGTGTALPKLVLGVLVQPYFK